MKDSLWIAWLAVALLAGIAEVTTLHLVFLMFAGGGVAAAGGALVGVPPVGQVLVFVAVSAALLGIVRPIGLRRLQAATPSTSTGVAALTGRTAEVTAEVTGRGGQVKLAGEVWSARWDGDGALPAGAWVTVLAIEGATAVVAPVPGSLPDYGAPAGEPAPPLAQDPPGRDPAAG